MTTPPKGNLPPRRPLTHSPYVAITNRERIRPSKVLSGCAVIQDLGPFGARYALNDSRSCSARASANPLQAGRLSDLISRPQTRREGP